MGNRPIKEDVIRSGIQYGTADIGLDHIIGIEINAAVFVHDRIARDIRGRRQVFALSLAKVVVHLTIFQLLEHLIVIEVHHGQARGFALQVSFYFLKDGGVVGIHVQDGFVPRGLGCIVGHVFHQVWWDILPGPKIVQLLGQGLYIFGDGNRCRRGNIYKLEVMGVSLLGLFQLTERPPLPFAFATSPEIRSAVRLNAGRDVGGFPCTG